MVIFQFGDLFGFGTPTLLNSRFTTVLVIALLDTVEVTPFFQILFL